MTTRAIPACGVGVGAGGGVAVGGLVAVGAGVGVEVGDQVAVAVAVDGLVAVGVGVGVEGGGCAALLVTRLVAVMEDAAVEGGSAMLTWAGVKVGSRVTVGSGGGKETTKRDA